MTFSPYLLAVLFLPLFPFSMLFSLVFARLRNPFLRILLLLGWPQIGVVLLTGADEIPQWIIFWALLTSLLYALRSLALREVGLWTSFIATSSWSLLWILFYYSPDIKPLSLFALGISVPLVMLTILAAGLERRFGAAYLGLYGGLAHTIPRFASILVFVVLAIIATPLFPTFFAMLTMIIKSILDAPTVAVGITIVWMLWSWAGAKFLQGLLAGPEQTEKADLGLAGTWVYALVLIGLAGAGLYGAGAIT